ncbi:DUF1127 domain-containing protein [Ferrovibrio sp.]|uniref:DUF1127 domain-containing protein n=1 Tax=Ferrovibrio sp. TaxID=1917215 RepID=UPI0025C0C8A1|nr:DUF1127 domain-containing protein [Ferrovibrio sp.]
MAECIDTIGQSPYLGPAERLFGSLGRAVDRIGKSAAEGMVAMVLGLLEWQRRADERATLQTLSDEMLRDVGLSRADIAGEAGKPFWLR